MVVGELVGELALVGSRSDVLELNDSEVMTLDRVFEPIVPDIAVVGRVLR